MKLETPKDCECGHSHKTLPSEHAITYSSRGETVIWFQCQALGCYSTLILRPDRHKFPPISVEKNNVNKLD